MQYQSDADYFTVYQPGQQVPTPFSISQQQPPISGYLYGPAPQGNNFSPQYYYNPNSSSSSSSSNNNRPNTLLYKPNVGNRPTQVPKISNNNALMNQQVASNPSLSAQQQPIQQQLQPIQQQQITQPAQQPNANISVNQQQQSQSNVAVNPYVVSLSGIENSLTTKAKGKIYSPKSTVDVTWFNNLPNTDKLEFMDVLFKAFAKCKPDQSLRDWDTYMASVKARTETKSFGRLREAVGKWTEIRDNQNLVSKMNGKRFVWSQIGKPFIESARSLYAEFINDPYDIPSGLRYSKFFWAMTTTDFVVEHIKFVASFIFAIVSNHPIDMIKPWWIVNLGETSASVKERNDRVMKVTLTARQKQNVKNLAFLPLSYYVGGSKSKEQPIYDELNSFMRTMIAKDLKFGDPEGDYYHAYSSFQRMISAILYFLKLLSSSEGIVFDNSEFDVTGSYTSVLEKFDEERMTKEYAQIYASRWGEVQETI